MRDERRLSLKRARRSGLLICLATLLGGVAFLVGLARESYWALAVPVAAGVFSLLGLAFWIGYTINTVRGIPAEADHYEGRQARRIALGICAGSVLTGVVFAGGVLRESYWALGIPVAAAVLGLLAMVFWIGWAIVTRRSTLPAAEDDAPEEAPEGGKVPADARS